MLYSIVSTGLRADGPKKPNLPGRFSVGKDVLSLLKEITVKLVLGG